MISFILNNKTITYQGDPQSSLLKYLRSEHHLIAAKDGCSGEGTCGACLVEINKKPRLACTTKMVNIEGSQIVTLEGIPENVKKTIGQSFVDKGAVQCGFCSPGFIMRTKILLEQNPNPSIQEIKKAINGNLCRCTGYQKIIEAVQLAASRLKGETIEIPGVTGKVGERLIKYNAFETAVGARPFTDDLFVEVMRFAVLHFSAYPKAKILKIDFAEAEQLPGVQKIVTAKDIPGKQRIGLIYNDWPLMIDEGEITRYIGDVLACVVADSEEIARKASEMIKVTYESYEPVTDPHEALKADAPQVHPDHSNLLDDSKVARGNASEVIESADFVAHGIFQTQRIEHAFLEKEAALAVRDGDGISLYSQSQGVYEDRRQVAIILGLDVEKVNVQLVPNGGGFGGKEDLSVQGHVSLAAWLTNKPVKLTLTRQESIRMHPKRHPVWMDMTVACNKEGMLTAVKLTAVGDTGAYASVGTKVMERVIGHATGGYYVPNIDLEAKTVYTNNIPCGAMRGFGANQVTFALEVLIDELCEKGKFDRWQFRYNNALVDGLLTSTGQQVFGVGIRDCLNAVKDDFYNAKYAGLATGIKNSGVGNGMVDQSAVRITVKSANKVLIEHGWTEMGQGVHNMAIQTLVTETGIPHELIDVTVDTRAQIQTGMTTSSRATALLGLAVIEAAKLLKQDLKVKSLSELVGNAYEGEYVCDWTTKPGAKVDKVITHYSYGYAAQLCVLDETGKIDKFYAAHDGGKVMNPLLFEGQIQGAVHMGLGYALTEDLPMKDGYLVSDKLRNCQILRVIDTPEIIVRMVEHPDLIGPYGAKGIGEIGLVPTAGAVANALTSFDHIRRYNLPLMRK